MPQDIVHPFPVSQEYIKNPALKPEDVAKLRSWLLTQPHLPQDHITDLDLILAYHCSEDSSEVAKQVLDLNITIRTLFPFLNSRDPMDKRVENAYHVALLAPMSTLTPDGFAVLYTRLVDYDPRNFIFSDVIKSAIMTLDLWQLEDGTWPGLIILIDMDGVQLGHLARLDLQTIQHILYFLQEAILLNLVGLHFLNAPSFMDKLMMMLKPFMKKPLLEVLHIHQIGSNTLAKFVPKKILPKECGGEYKDFNTLVDEQWQKVKANRDYYLSENKRRVTEAKRPGKPKTITDIFGGVEGSFKKLDID